MTSYSVYRLRRASILAVAAALAPGLAAPAQGCSTIRGAEKPTNYELVRDAAANGAVVLARAVEFVRRSPAPEERWGTVRFSVEEVLAGDVRASTLEEEGNLVFAGRSAAGDFSKPRSGAYAGACNAEDYRLDHHYLLFLMSLHGRWRVGGIAFSRINEEVDLPDSPWLQTVRHYLRVAALHDYDREKAALRRLRARAAAGADPRTFPAALVGDVDRHFATPTPAKSARDLLDLYQRAPDDEVRLQALWALAASPAPEVRELMRGLLMKEVRVEWLQPLSAYFEQAPDPAVFGRLASLYGGSPPDSPQRNTVKRALAAAASAADAERMVQLLHASTDGEVPDLALWFAGQGRDPRPAIADLNARMRGAYGRSLANAQALAALGDGPIVEWAEANAPGAPNTGDGWIALAVLAASPLPAADARVREIIAAGDPARLPELFSDYLLGGEARFNPHRWERSEEILRALAGRLEALWSLETQLAVQARWGGPQDKAMVAALLAQARTEIAAATKAEAAPTGSAVP
jgi:hypothetical protein